MPGPFAVSVPSRQLLVIRVTPEEAVEVEKLIEDGEWPLMDYPALFPSKDGAHLATMLLAAGMGCGSGRWWNELRPLIEEKFPGRIVETVEFKELAANV